MYKDDNHKPEMALALTDFEALCGFVSHEELVEVLEVSAAAERIRIAMLPSAFLLHICCGVCQIIIVLRRVVSWQQLEPALQLELVSSQHGLGCTAVADVATSVTSLDPQVSGPAYVKDR